MSVPCHECLVDRHSMCPYVQVSDRHDAEDPDYELVGKFCCCGQEWTEQQMTTAAEYGEYAHELARRGWSQP